MPNISLLSKNTIFFMILGLCASCGFRPAADKDSAVREDDAVPNLPNAHLDPDRGDMVLVLKFAKNDPASLAQALEKGTEQVKALETSLNQVLAKMASSLPKNSIRHQLADLRLLDKPTMRITRYFGDDAVSNFDPLSFQSVDFSYYEKGFFASGGRSYSGPHSLFAPKLVWPDLAQEKILKLKDQHDDLVFANMDAQVTPPLIAWKIEIPYREILGRLFRSDAYSFDHTKTGKAFLEKLRSDQSLASPPNDYCQDIPEFLTKFIDADFSDLGKITDIACSVDKEESQVSNYIGTGFHTSTNYVLNLKFKIQNKQLSFAAKKWPFDGVFHDIVEQLLLVRYDMLF